MSILNQMRKNPAITAGAFIFIIALIVLIGWLVTRGSKGAAGPSGSAQGKPQIILNKTQKILHPNKSDVETYIVEYAEGVKGGSSAKYIDIKINWSNGGGFKMTGVTALKFTRKSGDTVIDTITTTGLSESDEYVTDFQPNLSVLFKGTDDVDKYLSNGKIPISIVVEYITVEGPQSLATTAIDITESDLDTTLNIDSITTINSLPVTSGKGFTPALDTSSTKTTYSIMFGDDGKQIPELREIRMKVDEYGWIEFHKDGTQVNVAGSVDKTQTYKFVEFGEDSGKYLFIGRYNNIGVGLYWLYIKNTDKVTGWSFTGETLAAGLSNIMADKAVYDRAFLKIIENSPNSSSRVYPPKPYPSGTYSSGDPVKNTYEWDVTGASYGNGTYKVKAESSLNYSAKPALNAQLDAEGIFNTGIGISSLPDSEDYKADFQQYHSPLDVMGVATASSFNFYLPVYIKLEKVNVFFRWINQTTINQMGGAWAIHGVDRSTGTAVETELYSNNELTFEKGVTKSLIANPSSSKFNEFKVSFDPAGEDWLKFNEILFYGTDESASV
jgi:hypothetical protein